MTSMDDAITAITQTPTHRVDGVGLGGVGGGGDHVRFPAHRDDVGGVAPARALAAVE